MKIGGGLSLSRLPGRRMVIRLAIALLLARLPGRRMVIRLAIAWSWSSPRDPPTGDPLPLPTERQWKDGMKWQRR